MYYILSYGFRKETLISYTNDILLVIKQAGKILGNLINYKMYIAVWLWLFYMHFCIFQC